MVIKCELSAVSYSHADMLEISTINNRIDILETPQFAKLSVENVTTAVNQVTSYLARRMAIVLIY